MILIPEKRDAGWLREGSTVSVDSEKRVQLQRELVMFRWGENKNHWSTCLFNARGGRFRLTAEGQPTEIVFNLHVRAVHPRSTIFRARACFPRLSLFLVLHSLSHHFRFSSNLWLRRISSALSSSLSSRSQLLINSSRHSSTCYVTRKWTIQRSLHFATAKSRSVLDDSTGGLKALAKDMGIDLESGGMPHRRSLRESVQPGRKPKLRWR